MDHAFIKDGMSLACPGGFDFDQSKNKKIVLKPSSNLDNLWPVVLPQFVTYSPMYFLAESFDCSLLVIPNNYFLE